MEILFASLGDIPFPSASWIFGLELNKEKLLSPSPMGLACPFTSSQRRSIVRPQEISVRSEPDPLHVFFSLRRGHLLVEFVGTSGGSLIDQLVASPE